MAFEIKDGTIIDLETNTPAGEEVLNVLKARYKLKTEKESEEILNSAVKNRVNEYKDKLKKAEDNNLLTAAEKEAYKERIAELEQETLSAGQKAELKVKQQQLELEKSLKDRETQYETLSKKHKDLIATNALMEASSKVGNADPEIIAAVLRPKEVWVNIQEQDGSNLYREEPRYKIKLLNEVTNKYEDSLVNAETAVKELLKQKPQLAPIRGLNGSGLLLNNNIGGSNISNFQTSSITEIQNQFFKKH